jgi:glucose-6-phosphate isomerase
MNPSTEVSVIAPLAAQFNLAAGIMENPAEHIVRPASVMRGYYQDGEALERLIAAGDPVHYETFESPVPEVPGHLRYCLSKLHAGTVGKECFMTKGHYHALAGTAEIYLCLRGAGLMLMKTADGRCAWEEFRPGRMVYVPPFWAHRSINTGDEPLVSLCIYPAEAGHNYGDIQTEGFPRRVFRHADELTIQ